jgi:hypothetical protein
MLFSFSILQRWFQNVKAFEKTIKFFHDVLQRKVTARALGSMQFDNSSILSK